MEKYCIFAIFFWTGLPLCVRGLIILESDASLIDDRNEKLSTVFGDRDDYREYPSANPISASSHELIKSESLSIDKESDGKDEAFGFLPNSEYVSDHHNNISLTARDVGGQESLNSDESSNGKEDGKKLPGLGHSNDYRFENLVDAGGHGFVESDPVIEKIPEDIESVYQLNKKRHLPDRGLTEETRKLMLDLHNIYRANVTPPAGDMNLLEWDDDLEHFAQLWADTCVFDHGRPKGSYIVEGKVVPYGQNLYLGTDPSGYRGLWMWYEEYMHYGLRNQTCKPNEQCGHYIQMAWAESNRLGCGMNLCGARYLIVCHYYPGALKGVQMYQVGRPCTQCIQEDGALCKEKLCVSHELCKRRPEICESATCNLKCKNCGRLDRTSCKCTCADGWDSPDCSKLCENEHVRCGVKPGFPSKASCSINGYSVAKTYCRKMCDTCASMTNDTTVNHLCCEGRLCERGYVLDLERKPCRCTLLCPGPLCDFMDDESSALKYNFIYLISQIVILYFINYTNHSL